MSNREKLPVDVNNQVQVALLVREWLRDPAHWCKGACFKKDGEIVEPSAASGYVAVPESSDYNQTCLAGAHYSVIGKIDEELLNNFAYFLGLNGAFGIVAINDAKSTIHPEVIALLDAAIEKHLGPASQ